MYISQLNLDDLDHTMINRVLFENLDDDGLRGDLIFVFGSKSAITYRVPKAVELYKANRARRILMSGGPSELPEAVLMQEAAMRLGAPESNIITEIKSTNTKENIVCSREVIDKLLGLNNISRILLVTNFFHLRRCLLTMKTYMPTWIDYSLCGVLDVNTRPDNWWTNEKGKTRVMNEVEKLIKYTSAKEIVDCLI